MNDDHTKSSDDIICIYTTYDSTEADLIKAQLESENIPCFLKSDNAGGMLPQLIMMTGIEIMVSKADEKLALQVMQDRSDNNEH